MKKLLAVLLCLMLALSAAGCGETPAGGEQPGATDAESPQATDDAPAESAPPAALPGEAEPQPQEDPVDRNIPPLVEMSVVPGSYDRCSASFVLYNNGEETCFYAPSYALEELVEQEWHEIVVDPPLTWNAVIYRLEPGSSVQLTVDWTIGYGELPDGAYRFCKTVSGQDDSWAIVTAEFSLPAVCEGVPLAPEGFAGTEQQS